ncbi:MAG: tetratricopeptide repeat protein [Prolixibacteraceae bacterium]
MKKFISTIVFLFFLMAAFAQEADSLKKANEYYAANQIGKAIKAYESIVNNGYESSTLYYNLGNAHYKNNDLVNALLNFERAKKLAPNDDDIQFNLDLVNQFVVDKIEPLPQPFYLKWGHSIIHMMKTDTWANLSLISFILTLIFGLGFVFIRIPGLKKVSFTIGLIVFMVASLSFTFAAKQKSDSIHKASAIIFSPSVTVKASPNESSVDLFVIHEGLKVEVLKNHNYWLEIKLEDGNRGWVQKDVLKII